MSAKNKIAPFIGLLISIAFFTITALVTLGQIHETAGLGMFQGMLIFAVAYAAVIAGLALGRLETLKEIFVTAMVDDSPSAGNAPRLRVRHQQ